MAEVNPAATPADFAQRNAPHNGGSGGSGAQGLFGSAAESVKNKAREIAEEQKTAGAERVGAMGRAVHGAADEVSKEMPGAASYIHAAADEIESVSTRLKNSSVDAIFARLDRFARKQPAAAFAGSVVAGFALSRFLKSSNH